MASRVLLFIISKFQRLLSYFFPTMMSRETRPKPCQRSNKPPPAIVYTSDPAPMQNTHTHIRRQRSSSVTPGVPRRMPRHNSLVRSSLPSLFHNSSNPIKSNMPTTTTTKLQRRNSTAIKISHVTATGITTERASPGVSGDRVRTKSPKKRNSPRSKPLGSSSESSIDLPRQTLRDSPRSKPREVPRILSRDKSDEKARDKTMLQSRSPPGKDKRVFSRPNFRKNTCKTSAKKYKEFGPSSHRNKESSSTQKPYKDLFAFLQKCKEQIQKQSEGSPAPNNPGTPIGVHSCPVAPVENPCDPGSTVDSHVIEDDEEDDDDVSKEVKGRTKSLSDVLKERHLADMLNIGRAISPQDLTSELAKRGYFDYNYSYNKHSRTTVNNDNVKDGKKKAMQNLYASISKKIPRNLDSY